MSRAASTQPRAGGPLAPIGEERVQTDRPGGRVGIATPLPGNRLQDERELDAVDGGPRRQVAGDVEVEEGAAGDPAPLFPANMVNPAPLLLLGLFS